MNKDKTNNKININEILALIATYLEKHIEYTELKMEHHKKWHSDEEECENEKCEDDECIGQCTEEAIISFSDDEQPSFGDSFKEEWS